ncbi:hypothetical protein CBA19CS91_01810 [Paraburkholderia hospita]|nr:hypothetical protein CBA19CS91_01810 [Paraburkholderia hospita]
MSRVFTRFHYAPETDTTAIERIQDCTPIAEHAKALHNAGIHGSSEVRHAAQIPFVLIERYCNDRGITFEEWMQNEEHIAAMLNDPALADFRIWKGRT